MSVRIKNANHSLNTMFHLGSLDMGNIIFNRRIMNLEAWEKDGEIPLFVRKCKNKKEAKKEILNNPRTYRIERVLFKRKPYSMKEVYQWS